ncbi:3-methyl-2-oxobutanoate hydroxymethyltransferase [Corynebacterium diphtheriae]|nr:3-methyl-2-oxobutanoate hydroxymethyltransferase [Corynebacterium diphtheriae]CAB0779973.1 3-methyl-2-oxobutanoate hydroxymethyltransferase [Corynebacterium diphtheriae]CAB0819569.1 3-methyl-2-oxobutanoate hydroxymethyltransferase [Corynebacterium diphtheriae]CAB0828766.1 3-methyl-2-oxobutanoate hydroxymethyltransferase [Corynebacterium diphtheriae]CAB0922201.1 3-methyl-2-oxobutanoate hydroxymethyltransferase [Corynebacterium diphtheriae]
MTRPVRLQDLRDYKKNNRPWAMLTTYDYSTTRAFVDGGIEVFLVGDSAANTMLGYSGTNQVSFEEMVMLTAAVVRGAGPAMVVADLPFGTYEASDEQAVRSATEMVRRTGAHVVKLEGGVRMASRIRAITDAGVPVCAHLGFTPQSMNQLSGFKVQRGAEKLTADVDAVVEAGAEMVVFEMVPADLAAELTARSPIPVIGIGAGNATDAQVLVWHDIANLPKGDHRARFVKTYAEVGSQLTCAARIYRKDVEAHRFPAEEHTF